MGLKNWGDEVDGADENPEPVQKDKNTNYIELVDGELPLPETTMDGTKKTVVTYTRRSDGRVEKKTRVFNMEQRKAVVSKSVMQRRSWAKFGVSKNLPAGPDSASTNIVVDDIYLALTSKKELKDDGDDGANNKLVGAPKRLVVCRICKGEHWTTKCPYKDKLGVPKDDDDGADGQDPANGGEADSAPTNTGGTSGRYVPPRQRLGRGGDGESMERREETASIRITNLSENTREEDLRELFRPFGHITRCYLATDRETGFARGFAFISYQRREDAQNAIDTLNGHGYDHLILQVDWAEDRKDR